MSGLSLQAGILVAQLINALGPVVRRIWLLFTQWVTVAVAVLFVVQTLRPEWLAWRPGAAPAKEVVVSQAPAGAHLMAPTPRPDSYHGAVQKALPAVVNIFTAKAVKRAPSPFANDPLFQRFFGDMLGDEPRRASSLGSGVVISSKGYVVTNNHVVEGADEIDIAFADGKKLRAKIVGTDPETDLAVLRVSGADARGRRRARDRQSVRRRSNRHDGHCLGAGAD